MNEEENRIDRESTKEGLRRYYFAGLTLFLVIVAASMLFLIAIKISTIFSAIKYILHILEPIVFGFVIAFLIAPVTRFIEQHLQEPLEKLTKSKQKASRIAGTLGIFLSLLLCLSLVALLIMMVIPELVENTSNLVRTLPAQIRAFSNTLARFLEKAGFETEGVTSLTDNLINKLNSWVQTDFLKTMNGWFGKFTNGMVSFFSTAINIIIGIVVAIYVLSSRRTFKRQLKQIIYAFFSRKHAQMLIETMHESNRIFTGFITGKMVDSLIIGVICFIGLSILRMPYTLLISVIVGVTNIIPFFGPYIGAVPSAILIFLVSPVKGLIFVVFILVLQQVDGNIIGPKILGESTGLSAFWVVFSILLFGGLFGVFGMLFGVPFFAVIYRLIANAVDYLLRKKGLSEVADLSKKEKES